MITAIKQPAFACDLLAEMAAKGTDFYAVFDFTKEQFQAAQSLTRAGGGLPANLPEAKQWAIDRSEKLHQEALGYEADGYGYGLQMPHCSFAVYDEFVLYESTSGTVFVVMGNDYSVYLPKTRKHGHHGELLALVASGMSQERIENLTVNAWQLFSEKSLEECMGVADGIKSVLDPILVPAGFQPKQNGAEYRASSKQREADRAASIAFLSHEGEESEGNDFPMGGEIDYGDE